jgi:SAM-dependent methyltransferase
MSHPEQTKFVIDCLTTIKSDFSKPDVLEVGSFNVNQLINYKKFIGNCDYLGIDLLEGPSVDLVLKGENINKLNKKFDIIVSTECFEHAENWKEIFKQMIEAIKPNGYIVLTVASKGRLEHGTSRTISSHSPGTGDYYKNLTRRDFFKNFKIDILFEDYFFFYNIHSYDLYIILGKIKKNNNIELIKKLYSNLYKNFPKLNNLKRFIICSIIGDKNFQDLRFQIKRLKKNIKI